MPSHPEFGNMLERMVADTSGRLVSLVEIRAMIEEASDRGAVRALERLGLGDDEAKADLDELRDLLTAWRDAKSSALKGLVHWVLRFLLVLALFGLATRFGVGEGAVKELLP